MADGGHVAGAVSLAQAGLVVGEGDVEDPVEAVLDRPVAADRRRRVCRGKRTGRGEEAGLGAGRPLALDAGLGTDEAGGRTVRLQGATQSLLIHLDARGTVPVPYRGAGGMRGGSLT